MEFEFNMSFREVHLNPGTLCRIFVLFHRASHKFVYLHFYSSSYYIIMKQNISSLIRYRAINRCIIERVTANMDDLLKACIMATGDETITKDLVEGDIQEMKLPGPSGYAAPIAYDEKKKVYFYKSEGYSLDKISLMENEQELLKLAILYLDQLKSHESLKGLKGIVQKLVNSLRIRSLGSIGEVLDFVQPEIAEEAGGSQFLKPLIEAIRGKKVVRLYYLPFYEDKPYFILVHPYLLKEYRGRWYLIGLNDTKKEIRTYGLDRIWEMHEVEQAYLSKSFDASAFFRNTIGIISPMGEPPEIRLSVTKHQAQYLITQPMHESQLIEQEDEERTVFRYKVHPTYEFKSWILSLGPEARVLSPDSLKKDVLRLLNDAILEYGKVNGLS